MGIVGKTGREQHSVRPTALDPSSPRFGLAVRICLITCWPPPLALLCFILTSTAMGMTGVARPTSLSSRASAAAIHNPAARLSANTCAHRILSALL